MTDLTERLSAQGIEGLETVPTGEGVVAMSNGRLGLVVLDRPPVNALGEATYGALSAAFERMATEPDLACLVFTASGNRAFCAGADVNERGDLGRDPRARHHREAVVARTYRAVTAVRAPIVAAIGGPCIGAGAVLASLTDIRVASPSAWFSIPEIDIGAVGASRHLMRFLPVGVVRELALTGRRLHVEEAHRYGFVNQVTEDDDVFGGAIGIAATLLDKDLDALLATKATLDRVEELDLDAGFELEQAASFRLGMTRAADTE